MRIILALLMMTAPLTAAPWDGVLEFWFGPTEEQNQLTSERLNLWFGKNPANDRAVSYQFEHLLQAAITNDLDDWKETPEGCLALVVLLDQFPRMIYRDHAQGWAYDHKSLALVVDAIASGQDRELNTLQRTVFYLPLMHAENLAMQHLSIEAYEGLLNEAPESLHEAVAGSLSYAHRHLVVIEQFKEFPHRNAILGRSSSQAEIDYLFENGQPF